MTKIILPVLALLTFTSSARADDKPVVVAAVEPAVAAKTKPPAAAPAPAAKADKKAPAAMTPLEAAQLDGHVAHALHLNSEIDRIAVERDRRQNEADAICAKYGFSLREYLQGAAAVDLKTGSIRRAGPAPSPQK